MGKLENADDICMDSFKAIYKILKRLDGELDHAEIDERPFSASVLKISEIRRARYFNMLQKAGYIEGVRIFGTIDGDVDVDISGAAITVKGLEYLAENATIRKMCKIVKGVGGFIPQVT